MFYPEPENFELSPRFLDALLRTGSGVGLLGRAHDDVTSRAHRLWEETGERNLRLFPSQTESLCEALLKLLQRLFERHQKE